MKRTEIIIFRLYNMPCCHVLICWVNPRRPNFCPECGEKVYMKLKFEEADHLVSKDDKAQIVYSQ